MDYLLIFDFDGVIVDSELIIRNVLNEYIEKLGVKGNSANDFIGIGGAVLIKKIEEISGTQITDMMIHEYNKGLFEALNQKIKPLLANTFGMLQNQGYKYCIASNSIREQVNLCLKAVNMSHYFTDDAIFTIEQVKSGKPEPDLFLLAANSWQIDKNKCLVIEDSPSGIRAAQAADMNVVAFMGGEHAKTQEYMDKIAAHQTILLPDEIALLNYLKSEYQLKLT